MQQYYAFFPLLPGLIAASSWPFVALGLSKPSAVLLSGVLISNGMFVISAYLLYR